MKSRTVLSFWKTHGKRVTRLPCSRDFLFPVTHSENIILSRLLSGTRVICSPPASPFKDSIILSPESVTTETRATNMDFTKFLAQTMDAVTLPFYYPFKEEVKSVTASKVKMLPIDINEPHARVWVRADKQPETLIDDVCTVDQMMRKVINLYGNQDILGYRKILAKDPINKTKSLSNELTWISFPEFNTILDNLIRGFASLGISPGDRVVIFMETRLEWFLASQALYRMGATVVTLYATLGDDGVIHGLNEVEAKCIITSNDLLPKVNKISDQLPHLKTLFVVRDQVDGLREKFSLESILNSSTQETMSLIPFEDLMEGRLECNTSTNMTPPSKDDIALLMYTSGSTGEPKAVAHTHESIVSGLQFLCQFFQQQNFSKDAKYISYLPLAHIMEHFSCMTFAVLGLPVAFGSPYTLLASSPGLTKGSLPDTIVVEPEVMVGVPLMFDRIRKTVEQVVASKGSFFKTTFEYLMNYKRDWNNKGYRTPLVDRLFVNKTRKMFGGKLTTIVSGGAPLSTDTQALIQSCLGLDVLIVYGATEVAATTMMCRGDRTLGSTGIPLGHNSVKLINWEEGGYRVTDKPNPRGEVVIGGQSVSNGYFMKETETKECFSTDSNGMKWWASGDIGEILPDGSLKIIDRKKDLVKLAFGEYISLGKVEANLKSCPIVDNICVYADGKYNFIVAFIAPNIAVLNDLAKSLDKEPLTEGSEGSLEKLCNDSDIKKAVLDQIKLYGSRAGLLRYEIPVQIKLCHESWTPDSGLVTAALKIRRRPIQDFYCKDLQAMFS